MVEQVESADFLTSVLDSDQATGREYDLGVWFCGYEERSPWLVNSSFCPRKVKHWLHVEVEEDRSAHRAPQNLRLATGDLLGGGPANRGWDGHWRLAWRSAISAANQRAGHPISIFVDISSMPRAIYGALLVEACRESTRLISELVLAYVPGEYRGTIPGHQQLDGLRTLSGLEGASRFEVEPALILGLGYDGVLADTIVELFQLEHVSCFYADPGATESAAERCRDQNAVLLSRAELVETASAGDLTSWLYSIERLVTWYEPHRDIMLLPIGPKPQVVASILFALRHPTVGFRCLRASKTLPIDVGVPENAQPLWMGVKLNH